MIAIECWYYYVYNTYPFDNHAHDWEMHAVVFLNQANEQQVLLVGTAAHWWINYYDWSTVEKVEGHPKIYVASGSHAAGTRRDNIPWESWAGDGVKLSYGSFLNVFVLHTTPCRDHYDNYCNIVKDLDWQGNHFYWDWTGVPNSRDWWPKNYGSGVGDAPWHRYTWDEPTTGNPSM